MNIIYIDQKFDVLLKNFVFHLRWKYSFTARKKQKWIIRHYTSIVICFLSVFMCFTCCCVNGFWQCSSLLFDGFSENCWMSHQNCLNHLWQIGNWSVNAISFLRLPSFTSLLYSISSWFSFPSLNIIFSIYLSTEISSERKHLYDRKFRK